MRFITKISLVSFSLLFNACAHEMLQVTDNKDAAAADNAPAITQAAQAEPQREVASEPVAVKEEMMMNRAAQPKLERARVPVVEKAHPAPLMPSAADAKPVTPDSAAVTANAAPMEASASAAPLIEFRWWLIGLSILAALFLVLSRKLRQNRNF